jgi:hypothetical protein
MITKWWGRSRKYIENNRAQIKDKTRKQLDFLIEFGNEEDIVEKARIWNPKITDTEIEKVVKLFRAAKTAKHENERVR